jgi:hypothetical protein
LSFAGEEREEQVLFPPFPSNETVISGKCSSCIGVEETSAASNHRNGQKMGKKESGFQFHYTV